MKVFPAFCFFFGSILGVGALLLFCFLLAPAEYTLGKDAVKIASGTFRHPERIFPDLAVKSRYNYPGMQAGLKAKNTNTTAFVLVPRDTEQARAILAS